MYDLAGLGLVVTEEKEDAAVRGRERAQDRGVIVDDAAEEGKEVRKHALRANPKREREREREREEGREGVRLRVLVR